ncbi:MAG: hypothetical protein A3F11_02685 [Gammaproteobacteria bacterium RIFCSPHIGHO2_12_FULL_37_14]|nr:MAG: hypothetical protein A3F11_02685 [Gammaproteobacteria bacterium RIFCSPHIGHO2_12_FULL_37_14]
MRIFLFILILSLLSFSFIYDAQARRFGGGKSFGMSRNSNSFSNARFGDSAKQSALSRPSNANRWLGPLAGLAAGGLLAYLLMGNGIGSGMLTWLLVAGVIWLIYSLIRNAMRPATQSFGYRERENSPQDNLAHLASRQTFSSSTQNTTPHSVDFDENIFLRDAKALFLRLQTAYDNKNLNDLCEFCSPEVFAEIQLQIQERGEAINRTEVVQLDAALLDTAIEFQVLLASVQFSGLIKEDTNQTAATSFKEVWHFRKENINPRWIVAGIQQ